MELLANNYLKVCNALKQFYHQMLLKLSSCDLCGEACHHYLLLCQNCFADLPRFNTEVIQGDLLNWPAVNQILPKVYFDHLICLAPYDTPYKQWLSQFKYNGRFDIAKLLAMLLAEHYQLVIKQHTHLQAELIVSVPLHITKWQQRGFNQAHLLADILSKELAKEGIEQHIIPYDNKALTRNKSTSSQVGKSGVLRRKSLRNTFNVQFSQTTAPEHVLLIDDVVTTGATASEISHCLKQAGVKRVTVLALCLSLPL